MASGGTDIYARGFMTAKELERFFKFVLPEPNTGCWLWTGRHQNKGYGVFWFAAAQKAVLAHRLIYLQIGRLIPPDCELHHLCETPSCVNPDHLESLTHRENVLRSSHCPTAQNARKTHCSKGHPYSEENTFSVPSYYGRHCKECNRIRATANYYRTRKVMNPRRLVNPREVTIG